MVCGQRQPQQPADDAAENVVVHGTASPHHHQVCYHAATKCPTTTLGDYSPSRGQRPSDDASSPVVGAADARRPVHIVIDALRTTPDDARRRLRRLPTSQITCRVLQTSTVPCRRSLAEPTTSSRKAITSDCNGRQWTGAVDTRTGLTDSYCRPQQRHVSAAYRYVKQNGNI